MNLYLAVITIEAIVVFATNRMKYNDKCIKTTVKSPVSVQVWRAISSRGLYLLRKQDGNMNSIKYQSDIIHDIEMACGCVLFPQKGCIFIHDLAPYHNTKITRTSIECKGIPILYWPEKLSDKHPIANVWNIMQQEIVNQMPCKMEICESKYVMRGIRPGRTLQFNAKENRRCH